MSNRAKAILLVFIDTLILYSALTVVIYLRIGDLREHYLLFSYIFPFWLMMYLTEGLYTLKTYNPVNLPISVLRGNFISVIFSFTVFYLLPKRVTGFTPKTNLILVAALVIPILFLWRKFFFKFFAKAGKQRGTLLIGSPETLEIVEEEITRKPHLGYKIVGSYLPTIEELPDITDVHLIAVERNLSKDSQVYKEIFTKLGEVEVIDLAKFAEKISGKIPIRAIDESWFIEHCGHSDSRSFDLMKGFVDKSVTIFLIILLIPVSLILLPILFVVHGRPIFFKQERTGLNNKPFTLYKLRTMVLDAEKAGAQWASPGDSRITPLGKILRRTRLDELPQLINILKGEMSLVGPRPERPEIIEKQLAPIIPFYNLRHLVKPGVTGWAQVTFRYGFSSEDSKEKLQFDLFYVKNRSGWLDLIILLKTIKTVLTGAGQ